MISDQSVRSISHSLKTLDGYQLALIEIVPKNGNIRSNILFNAGTVIRKEFYLKLAKYLAANGNRCILYDYRGVGASRPKILKDFKANISDWGLHDAPAVVDWVFDRYGYVPLHLLAHSMGGQILGLMHNWEKFSNILMLATSSGNYNNFKNPEKFWIKTSTNLLFPIVLPLAGYAVGKFGLGDDWPKGVAEDWWSVSKKNRLMKEHMEEKLSKTYYETITKRITAWFFPTDHMATARTIPNLQLSYPKSEVTTMLIQPKDFELDTIGHFGIFKQSAATIWPTILATLGS